jgi:hypothetical protein
VIDEPDTSFAFNFMQLSDTAPYLDSIGDCTVRVSVAKYTVTALAPLKSNMQEMFANLCRHMFVFY